jgi:hypothetical protein
MECQCLNPHFYHLIYQKQIKYYKLVKKRKDVRVGINYDKTMNIV